MFNIQSWIWLEEFDISSWIGGGVKIRDLQLERGGDLISEVGWMDGWMEEFDMWSWMDGGV
jgi:hypothetical protein